jgi:acetyl-CoA carboxylase carboxyl transferase subunit beta
MAKYVTIQVVPREPPPGQQAEGERCKKCSKPLEKGELKRTLRVCPHCGYHYPMPAHERVAQLADPGSATFIGEDLRAGDPLGFFDLKAYPDRMSEAQAKTGLTEAFLATLCTISGHPTALGILDFNFLGGSMGSVVGERFTRLAKAAIEDRRAFVVIASSGGARMQEGLFSLMQMAKTIFAASMVADARLPYITILTHPTTGGVFASWATTADIILAEPGAVMSFAGARVIEQTTHEKLPADFGSSESQLAHGQVDLVVDRRDLKAKLSECLELLSGGVSGY